MPGGTLYLMPTLLGEMDAERVIPSGAAETIRGLDYFIAENPKSARAFLKQIGIECPLQGVAIAQLDVNTSAGELAGLLQPILEGRDGAMMSEAGAPAVADPGAPLVRLAHMHGIKVVPLVGPSAILLALMASGFNGQRFAFHGYLPKDTPSLVAKLRELEKLSRLRDETQIFIETPYRNDRLLDALVQNCDAGTLLCVASDLTLATESLRARSIAQWRASSKEIGRRPSVFLLYAGQQAAG
jgi:16S rRNA (cytidine1402-2'-O)-methyltransferase